MKTTGGDGSGGDTGGRGPRGVGCRVPGLPGCSRPCLLPSGDPLQAPPLLQPGYKTRGADEQWGAVE